MRRHRLSGISGISGIFGISWIDSLAVAGLIGLAALVGLIGPVDEARGQDIVYVFPSSFCPGSEITEIRIDMPASSPARLYVVDALMDEVREIHDGNLSAGSHLFTWDGRDDQEQPIETGEYQVFLDTTPNIVDRDDDEGFTAFCGADLGEPARLVYDGQDMAVALGIGLPVEAGGSFEIRTADGGQLVRSFDVGLSFPAGVSTIYWLLIDDTLTLVDPGTYMARLITGVYSEDLLFAVDPWGQIITVGATIVDADDQVAVGTANFALAPVVRTPLQEARIDFSIPLTDQLMWVIGNLFWPQGSLANFEDEGAYLTPDRTTVVVPGMDITENWPDRWGLGSFFLPMFGVEPQELFFHLRHDFTGVTHTDELCELVGPVDPKDWLCGPPYWWDEYADAAAMQPPVEFALGPACPNPVNTDFFSVTTIRFAVPTTSAVRLYVVDTQGERIRTLAEGAYLPGFYELQWPLDDDDGADVPESFYRVFMEAGPTLDETDVLCAGDVWIRSAVAAPEDPVVVAGGSRLVVESNPILHGGGTRLLCYPGRAGGVALAIHDLRGRRVRELLRVDAAAGEAIPVIWDGRDEGGAVAPAGVYFARFEAAGQVVTEKLVIVR